MSIVALDCQGINLKVICYGFQRAMLTITTLVLGIGNTLLSDEGAGIHVINYLWQRYPSLPGIRYLDGGTLSFTLAGPIEEATHLIVIDAAELGAKAGTIQTFIDRDMDRFLGETKRSVHEVGLMDLMDIARLTDSLPVRRALIGIQPEALGWGDQPSSQVANAIPVAANRALQLARCWQEQATAMNPGGE
jgi:hydrogenase maturation protease